MKVWAVSDTWEGDEDEGGEKQNVVQTIRLMQLQKFALLCLSLTKLSLYQENVYIQF